MGTQSFRVHVTKDYLKFSAAHFMAYKGFRETLHGHNYRVSVDVEGELGAQGYVLDFGVVKRIARRVCDRLDAKTLIPAQSDCLQIREEAGQVSVRYEADEFRFPVQDVVLVPIAHSSAEELARYVAGEIQHELAVEGVQRIRAIEIGVEETSGQAAYFRESL
jgi:6-pyruvoyltetrahydropterin/6-carboxytetrahydropterin synthase